MKSLNRFFSSVLAVIIAASCVTASAFAEEAEIQDSGTAEGALWADGNPDVDSADETALDVVKWFSQADQGKGMTDLGASSEHYYLLLPTTADLDNLTVWHSFDANPTVNGTELVSGQSTAAFSGEGDYTMTVSEKTYTVTVMQSKYIGSMYIATESGNMDYIHAYKENKESGSILVVQADGTVDYDKGLDQIKGRGNTTWTNLEKKPYNIKLEKKASLLGMDTSKKWCLLANGQDHSLIRNKVAFDLADEVGLNYSPDSQYVDLYLNGEYAGVYQVSEKVEIGDNNLVKVNDLEGQTEELNDTDLASYEYKNGGTKAGRKKYFNIPNNPEDITGGYLMEYEVESKYNEELSGFVTSRGQYVVLKGPEVASKEQVDYISTFVQEMEDAIYSSSGYNSLGKHYTEYIDAESAALMYLIQEYSVNIDCGITSCFFYKDSDVNGDGKIHAGPAWDFDVSFGNLESEKDGVSMKSTDHWFAKKSSQYGTGQKTIFARLCEHGDFWTVVESVYESKFKPALDILNSSDCTQGEYVKSIPQYRSELEPSASMNFVRWRIADSLLVSSAGKTFDSQIKYLSNFLSKRERFLSDNLLGSSDTDEDSDTDKSSIVYFNNTLGWDNVYIHYWGVSANTQWPGKEMTSLGNDVYMFDFSTVGIRDLSNVNIIFNNGHGNGRQTEDLVPEVGMMFTPYNEPSRTSTDDEAVKYFYDGTWGKYSEGTTVLLGDVNGDGRVTAADAVVIQRQVAGLITLSDIQKLAADIDSNGRISASDAVNIQRYCAGGKVDYPINKAISA